MSTTAPSARRRGTGKVGVFRRARQACGQGPRGRHGEKVVKPPVDGKDGKPAEPTSA